MNCKILMIILCCATSFIYPMEKSGIYSVSKLPDFLSRSVQYQPQLALNYWLLIAVWHQDLQKAQEFLDLGAKPNKRLTMRGMGLLASILWVAVSLENVNMVKLLLDYGAKLEKAKGYTHRVDNEIALREEIRKSYAQLKSIPDDIYLRYRSFYTYDPSFTIFNLINRMPSNDKTREIKKLLEEYRDGIKKPTRAPGAKSEEMPMFKPQEPTPKPTKPGKPQTPTGKTAYQEAILKAGWNENQMLWVTAYVGDLEGFKKALPTAVQKGWINDLHAIGAGRGKIPAVTAAILQKDSDTSAAQYLEILNRLLQAGANPNEPDEYGNSPLIWAALTDAPRDFFKALLDAGADRNVTGSKGAPLLDLITDPETKEFVQDYKPGAIPPVTPPYEPIPPMTSIETSLNNLAKAFNKLTEAVIEQLP